MDAHAPILSIAQAVRHHPWADRPAVGGYVRVGKALLEFGRAHDLRKSSQASALRLKGARSECTIASEAMYLTHYVLCSLG